MNVRWIAVIVLLVAAARPVAAQSLLLTQDDFNYVGFEILKPEFDGDSNTSFLTLAAFATLRYKVQPNLAVVAEIPYARYDPKQYGSSESTVGDLYLGLEERAARDGASFEFGVRIPMASEDKGAAETVGIFSDVNRWEAFLPKVFSVVIGANYRYLDADGLGVRLRLAPSLDVPTEGGGDSEVYGLYTVQFIYLGPQAEVTVGLSGRVWITEGALDFGQRSVHQLDAAVSLAGQKVRPGLQLRVPVDEDFQDVVDAVVGLQVAVVLD